MKKFILSAAVIISFIAYAFNQKISAVIPSTPENVNNMPTVIPPVTQPVGAVSVGKYKTGLYTGSLANAYYGNIQVQANNQSGKIVDVIFLDHPQDRSTSVRINDYAMPILKSEVIQAQDSNVDTVSGATFTSAAFRKSLASALAQAVN